MNKSTSSTIDNLQFIMLYMTTIGIINHVIIIPSLLSESGRDAWVAVIATLVFTSIYLIMIYFIMKRTNQKEIFSWLTQHLGKFPARLIAFLCVLTFFVSNIVILRDTSMWTKVSYLPETPLLIIIIAIIIPCWIAAAMGLQTIAITNGILLPFVIIFGFLVMSGNFPKKNYNLLFPLLEHGYKPILTGMVYVSSGIVQLISAVLIQHRLKKKMKYRTLFLTGLILILLTLGPTIGSIAEFGIRASTRFRYPAFEQWVILSIGEFIEHVDFLSIYQWLTGTFINLSLGLYLILKMLKIQRGAKRAWVSLFVTIITVICALLPPSDIIFWKVTHVYLLPGIFINLLLVSLLLFIFSFKKKKEGVSS